MKDVFLTATPPPPARDTPMHRGPGWAGVSARAHARVPAFPVALGPAGEAVTAEPSVLVLLAFVAFPPPVAVMLVL